MSPALPYAPIRRSASVSTYPILRTEFYAFSDCHNFFFKKIKIIVAAAGIARYDTDG